MNAPAMLDVLWRSGLRFGVTRPDDDPVIKCLDPSCHQLIANASQRNRIKFLGSNALCTFGRKVQPT